MKKLFFLCLLITGSFSVQAQGLFNDTLFLKVDHLLLQLEDRLDGISMGQMDAIRTSLQPIMARTQGKKLTQQQRTRFRKEVRKVVVAELTPAQITQLKATRRGKKDALDQAMSGKNGG